jgi:hypothetical protein
MLTAKTGKGAPNGTREVFEKISEHNAQWESTLESFLYNSELD